MNQLRNKGVLESLVDYLGAMWLGVALMIILAIVMGWATFIEREMGSNVAQSLIYAANWFYALIGLLVVNVLCSILTRVLNILHGMSHTRALAPDCAFKQSKRAACHSIPFVITHLGIIILLLGCVFTARHGVKARATISEGSWTQTAIDCDHRLFDLAYGGFNDFASCHDDATAPLLEPGEKAKKIEKNFDGGPLNWSALRQANVWKETLDAPLLSARSEANFFQRLAKGATRASHFCAKLAACAAINAKPREIFNQDGLKLEVLDYMTCYDYQPVPELQGTVTVRDKDGTTANKELTLDFPFETTAARDAVAYSWRSRRVTLDNGVRVVYVVADSAQEANALLLSAPQDQDEQVKPQILLDQSSMLNLDGRVVLVVDGQRVCKPLADLSLLSQRYGDLASQRFNITSQLTEVQRRLNLETNRQDLGDNSLSDVAPLQDTTEEKLNAIGQKLRELDAQFASLADAYQLNPEDEKTKLAFEQARQARDEQTVLIRLYHTWSTLEKNTSNAQDFCDRLQSMQKQCQTQLEQITQLETMSTLGQTGWRVEFCEIDPTVLSNVQELLGWTVRMTLRSPENVQEKITLNSDLTERNSYPASKRVFGSVYFEAQSGSDNLYGRAWHKDLGKAKLEIMQSPQPGVYYRYNDGANHVQCGQLELQSLEDAERLYSAKSVALTTPDNTLTPQITEFTLKSFAFHDEFGARLCATNFDKERANPFYGVAKVRATLDDVTEEFWLRTIPLESVDLRQRAQFTRRIVSAERVAQIALSDHSVDLGAILYVKRFTPVYEPGSATAASFSSLVRVLPANLTEEEIIAEIKEHSERDALIQMNRPGVLRSPDSSSTFWAYQESFSGPYRPGDEQFDQVAGGKILPTEDVPRDALYHTVISLNNDPGRGLKYLGALLLLWGTALLIYRRKKTTEPNATTKTTPNAKETIPLLALFLAACLCFTLCPNAIRADEIWPEPEVVNQEVNNQEVNSQEVNTSSLVPVAALAAIALVAFLLRFYLPKVFKKNALKALQTPAFDAMDARQVSQTDPDAANRNGRVNLTILIALLVVGAIFTLCPVVVRADHIMPSELFFHNESRHILPATIMGLIVITGFAIRICYREKFKKWSQTSVRNMDNVDEQNDSCNVDDPNHSGRCTLSFLVVSCLCTTFAFAIYPAMARADAIVPPRLDPSNRCKNYVVLGLVVLIALILKITLRKVFMKRLNNATSERVENAQEQSAHEDTPASTSDKSADSTRSGRSAIILTLALSLASILTLALSFGMRNAYATDVDWTPWRETPVFDGGRRQPLNTFAEILVRDITGSNVPTIYMPREIINELQNDNPQYLTYEDYKESTLRGRDQSQLNDAQKAALDQMLHAAYDKEREAFIQARQDVAERLNALYPISSANFPVTRKYAAYELLFAWLVEPELWNFIPFIADNDNLVAKNVLKLTPEQIAARRGRLSPNDITAYAPHSSDRLIDLYRAKGAAADPKTIKALNAVEERLANFDSLTFLPMAHASEAPQTYLRTLIYGAPSAHAGIVGAPSYGALMKLELASQELERLLPEEEPSLRQASPWNDKEFLLRQRVALDSHTQSEPLKIAREILTLSDRSAREPVDAVGPKFEELAAALLQARQKLDSHRCEILANQTYSNDYRLNVQRAYDALAEVSDTLERAYLAETAAPGKALRVVPLVRAKIFDVTASQDAPWATLQTVLWQTPQAYRRFIDPSFPQPTENNVEQNQEPTFASLGNWAHALQGILDDPNPRAPAVAFAKAAIAYRDHQAYPERNGEISDALQQFVTALQDAAEASLPQREALAKEAGLSAQNAEAILAKTAFCVDSKLRAETFYYKLNPFFWNWIACLVSTLAFLMSYVRGALLKRSRKGTNERFFFFLGLLSLCASCAVAFVGGAIRAYITGWAPVANMFETVVLLAFLIAFIAISYATAPLWANAYLTAWRACDFTRKSSTSGVLRNYSVLAIIRVALTLGACLLALWLWRSGRQFDDGVAVALAHAMQNALAMHGVLDFCVVLMVLVALLWLAPRFCATIVALMLFPGVFWRAPREIVKARREETLQRRGVLAASAIVALLVAASAYFNSAEFNPHIRPLMAVLRSNFWLTIHVLAIIISYALGAIAWVVSVCALASYIGGTYGVKKDPNCHDLPFDPPYACKLTPLVATMTRSAILFLAAGILLGARWADYSWGRFWSWDPKEVWALVTLLIYASALHLYRRSGQNRFVLNLGAVLGALAIIMTWYGLSFVMGGGGRHSYAAGESNKVAVLYLLVAANLIYALLACVRYTLTRRAYRAMHKTTKNTQDLTNNSVTRNDRPRKDAALHGRGKFKGRR
ncbi:MAG: cytochrome c biogenesis protein CcsA [Planctomycetia bacterium]|nr:cytochrome c biogenesis protein CcsA [Planctomycetia bacterium]